MNPITIFEMKDIWKLKPNFRKFPEYQRRPEFNGKLHEIPLELIFRKFSLNLHQIIKCVNYLNMNFVWFMV